MGLFSRKDSASEASSTRSRPMVSSEAQAAELRARARRRLAGAIALVLAAVIVLPMILDSEPVPVSDDIPIRIPERGTPYQPPVSDPQAQPGPSGPVAQNGDPAVPPDLSGAPAAQPPAGTPPATQTPPAQTPPAQQPPAQTAQTPPPTTTTPPKPEAKPPVTPPKPAEKPESQRSDDGARALALLEGRNAPAQTSPTPRPAASGNFVLQVASYTTQADANARRGKLHQAGVTNAFVEQASINGKQQYRLRVGPFPSREAAQAAQARLRTLGYDNGFIAAQ